MEIPRRATAILMLTALLGTAVLYGIVLITSSPTYIPLQDVDETMDGEYITTTGLLADEGAPSYTHLILRDNGSELKVVLDQSVKPLKDLMPGDLLEVTGQVEIYRGDIEVRIISDSGIRILKRANESTLPLSLVLKDPNRFSGMYLTTSGNLSYLNTYRDENRLLMRCPTGDIWLHSDSSLEGVRESLRNKEITVCGEVEFNGLQNRYEILINSSTAFTTGNITDVSEILAGNFSEGTAVCIRGFADTEVYENTAYGMIVESGRSLSVVAYGDTCSQMEQNDGKEVLVLGVLRYSTYSGSWRLVISSIREI